MSRRLAEAILRAVTYIRQHPQFIFTLLLVVSIPVIFLYSGQQFLSAADKKVERVASDRIGLMHDVFAGIVSENYDQPEVLDEYIKTIQEANHDISRFYVVSDDVDHVSIVAAMDKEMVGATTTIVQYYRASMTYEDETSLFTFINNDGHRYWEAYRPVRLVDGQVYYIFTEVQLAWIDELFAARVQNAYLWLLGLMMIVLFMAYRHLRLTDYGYLYKESKKAIETRDMFTNMVTHELRAPLTAIRGYASMIHENKEIDFKIREQGLRIEQSSERLLLIVNDLLEVARLQSGKLKVEFAKYDVCIIIKSTLSSLDSSAREKGIKLHHDLKNSECEITTDHKRLTQALTNLVSNAIKYTEQGTITVVLDDKGDHLQIRVQDTGMGIDANDQKKLFAPFFRVQSDDVSQITGSGLGMWITKQLVALLGGEIGVESIKGVGTHVVITLPKNPT